MHPRELAEAQSRLAILPDVAVFDLVDRSDLQQFELELRFSLVVRVFLILGDLADFSNDADSL